ncbi:MAG TPA: DHA2 family efflux MFS transporter permease subunit [Pseudonocardia sp.]|jgi:EmrB/QacA subfamily drug resistance transporter|nr:DHA2 family efflux MFS transporter permease subunit [Pseudonocardia sp.]
MSGELRVDRAAGRWVLAATVGGSGLAMLDSTVVNVALERLGRDLDADFAALQWVVNGYTLSLAALILLGGALGDRFGRRRVFLVGIVWFAVASALCGLAPTAGLLVAGRVLQGIGGALLTPGSLALIAASFRPEDRSRAIGAWSGLGGVAGAIGPFVGGALVDWTWRAVFWVNVPVAAAVILITLRHVPESRDPDAVGGIDLLGAALAVLGLGGITFALTEISTPGAGPTVLVAGAVGVLALAAFLLVEHRSPHPLVPLSMFRDPLFSGTNAVTLLLYGALGVFFFLLMLQMQTVAGFSPTVSGTALLPITALMLLLSARAGALADRIGPRPLMTVGPLLAAGGFLLAIRVGPGASYLTDVLPATVLLGLGLAATVAPLTATVLASADEHHAGIASGINNAVARSAGLLAVAVIPVAAGLGGADYTDPAVYDAGFRRAMLIGAVLLVVSSAMSAVLIRPARTVPPGPAAPTAPAAPDAPAVPAGSAASAGAAAPLRLAECAHCGVAGPQLHPGPCTPAAPAGPGTARA